MGRNHFSPTFDSARQNGPTPFPGLCGQSNLVFSCSFFVCASLRFVLFRDGAGLLCHFLSLGPIGQISFSALLSNPLEGLPFICGGAVIFGPEMDVYPNPAFPTPPPSQSARTTRGFSLFLGRRHLGDPVRRCSAWMRRFFLFSLLLPLRYPFYIDLRPRPGYPLYPLAHVRVTPPSVCPPPLPRFQKGTSD